VIGWGRNAIGAASLGSWKQVRKVSSGNGHCTAVQRGG